MTVLGEEASNMKAAPGNGLSAVPAAREALSEMLDGRCKLCGQVFPEEA